MTIEAISILAFILGFLGVIIALIAILVQGYLSKWTDKMIKKEDERARNIIKETQKMIEEGRKDTQRMIDEGNKRLGKILEQIDSSTKEILGEILKRA